MNSLLAYFYSLEFPLLKRWFLIDFGNFFLFFKPTGKVPVRQAANQRGNEISAQICQLRQLWQREYQELSIQPCHRRICCNNII
jgi:hypothetical protein